VLSESKTGVPRGAPSYAKAPEDDDVDLRRSVAESFPASDPGALHPPDRRPPAPAPEVTGHRPRPRRGSKPTQCHVTDGKGTFDLDHGARDRSPRSPPAPTRPTPRSCSPPGCWRARPSSQGPDRQALGQDHDGARAPRSSPTTTRRPGLLAVPGRAGLQPVGYGCTTCIGNSGPLDSRGQQGHQRQRPRGHGGPVGQPQLRGPHQPGRQDELPGLAAAGHRLRPGRDDGHRLRDRAARQGRRRQRRLPRGHLAPPEDVEEVIASVHHPELFEQGLRRRLRRR
jgi:hypothetical protein